MQTISRHIFTLVMVSILGAISTPLMCSTDQSTNLEVFEIIEIEEESKHDCEEEKTSFDQDEDSGSFRYSDSTTAATLLDTHFQLSIKKYMFWTIDQPPRV